MTTKHGLITDSFKIVKKARGGSKKEQRPPTPPSPVQQHNGDVIVYKGIKFSNNVLLRFSALALALWK